MSILKDYYLKDYYIFIILLILIIVFFIITLTGTVTLVYICFMYDTHIYNWIKHKIQTLCRFLDNQIYSYNTSSQNTINLYGGLKVINLTVHKRPIPSLFNLALNLCSLGTWNEERNKCMSLKTLYHLTLMCELENGVKVYCDKNEVIRISTLYDSSSDIDTHKIDLIDNVFTLNDMLITTQKRMGDSKYFLFAPFDNNCQVYLKNLLESVELYTDDVNKMVFQNLESLVPKLNPVVTIISSIGICLAVFFSKLLNKFNFNKVKRVKRSKGLKGKKSRKNKKVT